MWIPFGFATLAYATTASRVSKTALIDLAVARGDKKKKAKSKAVEEEDYAAVIVLPCVSQENAKALASTVVWTHATHTACKALIPSALADPAYVAWMAKLAEAQPKKDDE